MTDGLDSSFVNFVSLAVSVALAPETDLWVSANVLSLFLDDALRFWRFGLLPELPEVSPSCCTVTAVCVSTKDK